MFTKEKIPTQNDDTNVDPVAPYYAAAPGVVTELRGDTDPCYDADDHAIMMRYMSRYNSMPHNRGFVLVDTKDKHQASLVGTRKSTAASLSSELSVAEGRRVPMSPKRGPVFPTPPEQSHANPEELFALQEKKWMEQKKMMVAQSDKLDRLTLMMGKGGSNDAEIVALKKAVEELTADVAMLTEENLHTVSYEAFPVKDIYQSRNILDDTRTLVTRLIDKTEVIVGCMHQDRTHFENTLAARESEVAQLVIHTRNISWLLARIKRLYPNLPTSEDEGGDDEAEESEDIDDDAGDEALDRASTVAELSGGQHQLKHSIKSTPDQKSEDYKKISTAIKVTLLKPRDKSWTSVHRLQGFSVGTPLPANAHKMTVNDCEVDGTDEFSDTMPIKYNVNGKKGREVTTGRKDHLVKHMTTKPPSGKSDSHVEDDDGCVVEADESRPKKQRKIAKSNPVGFEGGKESAMMTTDDLVVDLSNSSSEGEHDEFIGKKKGVQKNAAECENDEHEKAN